MGNRASKKLMLLLFLVSQLCLYLGNSQVSVYRTIGPLVTIRTKRFRKQAPSQLGALYEPRL